MDSVASRSAPSLCVALSSVLDLDPRPSTGLPSPTISPYLTPKLSTENLQRHSSTMPHHIQSATPPSSIRKVNAPTPDPIPHKNREHGVSRFRNITLLLTTVGGRTERKGLLRPHDDVRGSASAAPRAGMSKSWGPRCVSRSRCRLPDPAGAKSVSHLRHAAGLTGAWVGGAGRAAQLGRATGRVSPRFALAFSRRGALTERGLRGVRTGVGKRAVPSRSLSLGNWPGNGRDYRYDRPLFLSVTGTLYTLRVPGLSVSRHCAS